MAKLPSFQFYPGDYLKDPDVSRCSSSTRGALWDILCHAFECQERGVFITNGKAWSLQDVANMARGGSAEERLTWLDELLTNNVLKIDQRGAVYSVRMVKDEELRQTRAECGGKGGNPALVKQKPTKSQPKGLDDSTSSQPPIEKDESEIPPSPADSSEKTNISDNLIKSTVLVNQNPTKSEIIDNQNPTPSSSVSSSTTTITPPTPPPGGEGAKAPTGTSPPGFEEFMKAYPVKDAQENARREWSRMKHAPPLAEILEAIELQIFHKAKKREKPNGWASEFPNPGKWIRNKRWRDDMQHVRAALEKNKAEKLRWLKSIRRQGGLSICCGKSIKTTPEGDSICEVCNERQDRPRPAND